MEYTKLKLECPTGILEGHGYDSCWGLGNFFSEYFSLRMLICYLHFIQAQTHISHTKLLSGASEEQPGHMHFT